MVFGVGRRIWPEIFLWVEQIRRRWKKGKSQEDLSASRSSLEVKTFFFIIGERSNVTHSLKKIRSKNAFKVKHKTLNRPLNIFTTKLTPYPEFLKNISCHHPRFSTRVQFMLKLMSLTFPAGLAISTSGTRRSSSWDKIPTMDLARLTAFVSQSRYQIWKPWKFNKLACFINYT